MAASMGQKMRQAANLIARDAKARAALWSVQVPPSITVKARDNVAEIRANAPPAYPNEVIRVRHPVFGFGQSGNAWSLAHRPRPPWVTNQYRPFLVPAANAKIDEATAIIASYIDDVCHDNGFEGSG